MTSEMYQCAGVVAKQSTRMPVKTCISLRASPAVANGRACVLYKNGSPFSPAQVTILPSVLFLPKHFLDTEKVVPAFFTRCTIGRERQHHQLDDNDSTTAFVV